MNCWEFLKCGREEGGLKIGELGVCPAYPVSGKSCWKVAGTFCSGEVQGSEAMKKDSCMSCEWFSMVNPVTGTNKDI
jgi:hypothetical protein